MDYEMFYTSHLGKGIKTSGSNIRYRCWRSECRKKPGHTFCVNISNGQYVCHRCEFNSDGYGKGNTKTFSKLLNIELPKDIQPSINIEYEDNFDQNIAEYVYTYLVEHLYLNSFHEQELINTRGLKYPDRYPYNLKSSNGASKLLQLVFSEDELTKCGLLYRRNLDNKLVTHGSIWDNRVIIPYYENNKVTFFRSRGNTKRKYLSPIGAKTRLRIWGTPQENNTQLIITEGEFKAMTAVEYGFNCMALPGMNSSYDKFKQVCIENCIKEVTICFDTQIDSKVAMENVEGAVSKLTNTLRENTNIKVYRSILPLDNDICNGLKTDIDQFILKKGPEAFYNIIINAQEIR